MSGNAREMASAIEEIIRANGQIPGSRLASAVKTRFPEWNPKNYAVRTLREFIATQVTGVIIVGRAGMDVIYAPEGVDHEAGSTANTGEPAVEFPDFWRIWVSPNNPFSLAVERTGLTVRAVPRKSSAEDEYVVLEPPGADVHRAVAAEFLLSVPSPLQERLRSAVNSPSVTWWQDWFQHLRSTAYLATWNSVRHGKLEELLGAQLREVGLEQKAIDNALRIIRENHALVPPRLRSNEAPWRFSGDELLRRLVIEAVQRMRPSELRELRLPLGLVLDALESNSR